MIQEQLERFNDNLASMMDATSFDELIAATNDAVLLAETNEGYSLNDENSQSVFATIDQIRQRVHVEMEKIKNTMTKEQADKVMELWATLTRIVRREKRLIAARREFDSFSGTVN